jgi:hypothetical protein
MPFKKGQSGNPKGRVEGSKNKNYLDASHWLGLAHKEVEIEKDPPTRVKIITWATELIMQKVPALPATPGDSLSNALESQILIKALERDAAIAESVPARE